MRWLTNGRESDKDEYIRSMSVGHDQPVVTGRPRSTRVYSVDELEKEGYIGFYRVGVCHCSLCEERRDRIRRDPLGEWRRMND